MTSRTKLKQIALLWAFILFGQSFYASVHADSDYQDLNPKVVAAIDRGLEWLKEQQGTEGLFHDHPGLTALAITAFLKHPQNKYAEADQPFIQKAIKILLEMQQPNGAIYDIDKQPALPNYNTSVALMALSSTKNPAYSEAITKGQGFIKGLQVADAEDVYFGGIGYGSRETVHDLSNMSFAMQALKESGFDDPEVWDKAIKFLERCQNRSETNDRDWSGDDGGFIYAPDGESKAGSDENGKPKSYASMTYAGILSFIYANVDKNDPRVQSAVDWIKKHFTVEENYGMEKQGLFYNYHTMAKALKTYGEPTIMDAKGISHDWYRELAEKLISEQNPQGFWQNEESRWMERDPVLVTSYAVLALATAYPQ
ncbi:MAG: terpene cyclase/mutase family protein [Candidatus Poribacteria bacterium]|nr:terpene cyclase/mutase family protein [Candidatus Poribacteria bacterium]